jgi:hypothetical protein
VAADDALDVEKYMVVAGPDEEVSRDCADRLVLRVRHPYGLEALVVRALADPVSERSERFERVVQLLDAFVDRPVEGLVACSPRGAAVPVVGHRDLAIPGVC